MLQLENAYNKLRDAIIQGVLKQGERLVEKDVCERFNVGRTPLREAIRQLQMEGFVEVLPRKGATIKRISIEDLENIYDFLALCEGHATRKAVQNIKEKEYRKLTKVNNELDQILKRKDSNGWKEVNKDFHQIFVHASNNSYLISTATNLRSIVYQHGFIGLSNPGNIEKFHKAHCEIMEAFEEKNPPKAATAMEQHIRDVGVEVIAFLKRFPGY